MCYPPIYNDMCFHRRASRWYDDNAGYNPGGFIICPWNEIANSTTNLNFRLATNGFMFHVKLYYCTCYYHFRIEMVKEPYVHLVPVLTRGKGYNEVYNFYKRDFVGKTPKDFKVTNISRIVSKDQVVDELILSFTHDIEMDYLLPDIAPTGKHVEIPLIIIMKFNGTKIAYAQIGMIDTKGLPIMGIEQAKKLLDISRKNIETGK